MAAKKTPTPKKAPKLDDRVRCDLRISKSFNKALEALCQELGMTKQAFIVSAVADRSAHLATLTPKKTRAKVLAAMRADFDKEMKALEQA